MMQNAVRTDLAMEARQAAGEIQGVEMEQSREERATVTRVRVRTPGGAHAIGKPMGTYVTIEQSDLYAGQTTDTLAQCIAREISALLQLPEGATALVVGLGNRDLTPDSLGPRVTREVLVSRHLFAQLGDQMDQRLRPVCVLSPGVTGETGVETGEVTAAVVQRVHPDCIIVVDALAARSTQRILTTIQISDAGVAPGSGVGNHRGALTQETLGVPVVAVGVPMVVHASTIVHDALERMAGEAGARVDVESLLSGLDAEKLVVTPAMVDEAVRNVASLVADGINLALYPGFTREELRAMRA